MIGAKRTVEVCDETLRDGGQAEGIAFSVESKLILLQAFDEIGIHFVVGGWPFSNPRDIEFFKRAKELDLKTANLMPFGSTRRKNLPPDEDPNLLALVDTGCRYATIFGKSWTFHATEILRVSLEENLEMIRSSVDFLTQRGMNVLYDAEHFFDGYRHDAEYALASLRAAAEGGACRLVLCDTNGGALPSQITAAAAQVCEAFPDHTIGIHTHNDSGTAVANTLMAVEQGVAHVQGTFNGHGERCGNADLCAIIPNLELKMDCDVVGRDKLQELTRVSRLVNEMANHAHNDKAPYVGRSAFAHKGGVHIDAARKNPLSYEHIEPETVGNVQRVLISDQAGRSAIIEKIESDYPHLDKRSPEVQRIYERLKEAEQFGYEFEGADASFLLLAQKAMGHFQPAFKRVGFRIIVEKFLTRDMRSEATVKILDPSGAEEHSAAEGNGPINALDSALRKALDRFYPQFQHVFLQDYNVRVLDSQRSTAARVRVLINSSDGEDTWGTVGVSENIIEASWEALVDSFEYKIYKDERERKRNGQQTK